MNNKVNLINLSIIPMFHKKFFKNMDISSLNLSINATQQKVLMIISDNISNSMTEISKMISLEKGSFTSTVDGLIKKGLLQRKYSDIDRRKIKLALTEEGKYMATEIKKIMEKLLEEKFKSFTDEEIKEFNNALNIIAKCTAKMI